MQQAKQFENKVRHKYHYEAPFGMQADDLDTVQGK